MKRTVIKDTAKHIVAIFAEMAIEDWFQVIDRDNLTDKECKAIEKEIDWQVNRVRKLLKWK